MTHLTRTSWNPFPSASYSVQILATALTAATLAWGAFAFGAVYPWGFWSMAVLAVTAGTAGLLAARADSPAVHAGVPTLTARGESLASHRDGRGTPPARRDDREYVSRGLLIGLVSIIASVALQLAPLPLDALIRLNANAIDLLRDFDLAFAANPGPHALSVWPAGTRIGLGLLASLALLLVGTARLVSLTGARRLIETIIIIGVGLALAGIVQKPLSTGTIYGFWIPQDGGSPFGPFVNRNHFAGWMLMTVPVALGYLCAGIAKGWRGVKSEWHDRLLWFASPGANRLIMVASGITVMALALVLTLSRSGMSALGVALAITGWFAVSRLQGRSRKLVALGYLALLSTLVLGWVGVDAVLSRFAEADWGQVNGRSGAWADAFATFQRHWLTGTGLNTYQVANLVYQRHDTASFMSAAHNDYLQLAAEGGVLLMAPVLLCLVVFARDARRRFREDGRSSSYWLRAGAVTGLVAIALQETVEFSLQIPGNAALFAVVCAIALHTPPHRLAR